MTELPLWLVALTVDGVTVVWTRAVPVPEPLRAGAKVMVNEPVPAPRTE